MTETVFTFNSDLRRRVRNLALGPKTPSNALVPTFEALYNSLHATEELFGDAWTEKANIKLRFYETKLDGYCVEIMDNGIGLNRENFESFRTYDSDLKAKKGGRGVGRLSWLKVFDHADISSTFLEEGSCQERTFSLKLDNNAPISGHSLAPALIFEVGTRVNLIGMKPEYAANLPVKVDTVIKKIVAHFISYLLADRHPDIRLIWFDGEMFSLPDFVDAKRISLGEDEFFIGSEGDRVQISISHNLLENSIVEGAAKHKLFFTANGRVVNENEIANALGLATAIDTNDGRYTYVGIVSSALLDENVNSERTNFDIDPEIIKQINDAALDKVRSVLSPEIGKVIKRQADLTKAVLRKYPRYSYLVQDPVEFAERRLPRNFRSAEQIYQQLSVFDFREQRDIERQVEVSSKSTDTEGSAIDTGVQQILARLTEQEFSVLADYTVRRKVLLDLLERRLGYKQDGTMKHEAEEALHKFVVPMQATSHDVHIDKHNLWILDDKLTYYEHWASDRQMKRTLQNSDSGSRPDVLLFGGRTIFHRPGTDQPVIMVEFKKPVRNDYTDEENPLSQIYGYIEELREGKVLDRNGALIQEIDSNTPFFCYIVADITTKLKSWLKMGQISTPLPGGAGYYGYNPDFKAFVQAVSYKYVVKDARLRNEAFFKRLAI